MAKKRLVDDKLRRSGTSITGSKLSKRTSTGMSVRDGMVLHELRMNSSNGSDSGRLMRARKLVTAADNELSSGAAAS